MLRYFDLHCDTPYRCYSEGLSFDSSALAVNSNRNIFSIHKQCFAFWIKDDHSSPFLLYKNMYNDFLKKFSEYDVNMVPVFTVEGGSLIENNIERLYDLSSDGIRSIGLTWNGKNNIASGVYSEGRVSDFGKKVISKMNDLLIACDLSHLNTESFFDACDHSFKPFVSHACLSSVFDLPRNITDEQIKAVCDRSGIIGICFYPLFLGGKDVFESVYKNIYNLLEKGYENNISIGSDFDGADMDEMLSDTSKIPKLYSFLLGKGIADSVLDKIFYKNADDFFANL